MNNNNAVIGLDATYAWDNEGRVTSQTYPSIGGYQGPSYSYQYDLLGRLSSITQNGSSQASATYGPASEMTSLSYFGYTESRTFNNLLQLTRQTVSGVFDTEYVFPTGQNNGQISSSIDHLSGQQVNYTYDALKRLVTAGTVSSQWGQAYTYDGFGNLTASTVTQGSGVNWANASYAATNQMIGVTYDANGNNMSSLYPSNPPVYDVENRMVYEVNAGIGAPTWSYDPSGKRVAQTYFAANPNYYTWTLYFYDIFGHPIETWSGDQSYPNTTITMTTNTYFGSKLIQSNGVAVVADRLGSVRANANGQRFSYLPYGEELTTTPDGQTKFGMYLRDSTSYSQDYANQRYYNPWFGRFNSVDPWVPRRRLRRIPQAGTCMHMPVATRLTTAIRSGLMSTRGSLLQATAIITQPH